MRTMITSVAVSVLLGGFSASAAQLPPDIIADSYLLRAEQAVRDGEYTRAQGEINKLLDLQKEHELDLPDEFHFRYAKAAASTDWPEQALEAVVKYLAAAGREGQHYVEALELMNKAQDAIEGGKGPQAALTDQSPPAQAAEQGPVEAQLDAGRTPETQEVKQVLINAAVPTEAQPAPECDLWRWRTGMFFRRATVQDVKACLEAGADPNSRGRGKGTPLHRAAEHNENPLVIEALLAAGADPNAKDENKETPLHQAARRHNENPMVIEALLAAGADPNAKEDENKETPLHQAAEHNEDPLVIEALLAAGADPNSRGRGKETPLHYAAEHNENPLVIEALLAAGANPKAKKDLWDDTPLGAAKSSKNTNAIEVLRRSRKGGPPILSTHVCRMWRTDVFFRTATVQDVKACLEAGADPKERGEYRKTPLHRAAEHNENPLVIEALLAAGADPNSRGRGKETPLHYAAGHNENPMVIEALLTAGADPLAQSSGGTPLYQAAGHNENPMVIEALLTAGADPKARNKWDGKKTPLHYAAEHNENPLVIEALLAAGADPNARSKWDGKKTPLHYAAEHNENPLVIEALLAAGADPNARSKFGTPLSYAAWTKDPAVIEVLFKSAAGADADLQWTPLDRAVLYNEDRAVIEALLAAGADPNARTPGAWMPLHWAAEHNEDPLVIEALLAAGADPNSLGALHKAAGRNENPAVVQALIAAGADPNSRRLSRTPLHWAAEHNENPLVIEALLAAGADPNARTAGGEWTPLHRAAGHNENPLVIEALLAAGADPMAKDKWGDTPLYAAEVQENITAIEVLRQPTADRERQVAAAQARRKAKSGPGFLEAVIGIAGGTAIAAAGGGTEEALEAGAVFAGGVIGGTSPRGSAAGVPAATSTGNVGTGTGGDSCEIPGYPRPPGGVANLGLSWCPASVSMQARAFALQAAGAQCALATGSSSTPAQINARRQEINAACGRLAALGAPNCQCPPGLRP